MSWKQDFSHFAERIVAERAWLLYIRLDVPASLHAAGKGRAASRVMCAGRVSSHREVSMTFGEEGRADEVKSFAGKKVAAGICAILLGYLSIHKFILGLTTPGIIMLLLTVTCVGYPVMHIIGIIEGIIYLTKSDEEFYRFYALEKKGWF
jgi:TM2 domain-containing membrane protein YozV